MFIIFTRERFHVRRKEKEHVGFNGGTSGTTQAFSGLSTKALSHKRNPSLPNE